MEVTGDFARDRAALDRDGVDDRGRMAFVRRHAERLHDELTDGGRRSPRLPELAAAAAAAVPGLVPDQAELAAERARETELGVLFWGLLAAARPGRHLMRSMLAPTPRALRELPAFRATGRADLGTAAIERRDGVAHVTVRNNRYLNAEDDAVVEDLETAVDLALLDDGVQVGVLRGAPMTHPRYAGRRVFNAGINLTELYHGRISLLGFILRRELGYLSKVYRGLADPALDGTVDKPWVGAVDTFAIGGGTQILLVLDHVVAGDDAYFRLPALREGIIPGAANLRLSRAVGARSARRLIFGDQRIGATEPEAQMLCDEVLPADRMDEGVAAAALRLANPAVPANRRMLRLAEEPIDVFRSYMSAYALEQARRLHSADLIANLQRNWLSRRTAGPAPRTPVETPAPSPAGPGAA